MSESEFPEHQRTQPRATKFNLDGDISTTDIKSRVMKQHGYEPGVELSPPKSMLRLKDQSQTDARKAFRDQ